MIRQTSVDAWAQILADLPRRRAQALRCVLDAPGSTALEMERASGNRYLNMRLSELERMGSVVAGEAKLCGVSGRMSITWHPADCPTANRYQSTARVNWREQCVEMQTILDGAQERIGALEAENERLRAQLVTH